MKYNYKADLITIGQWLESNVCFGVFNEPYTSNRTYQEIGEKFVRYIKMVEDGFVAPPEEKLNDKEIHAVMKYLVAYRLTPHAIAFAYQNKDEFPFQNKYVMERNCVSKSVMYLSDRALCKFHITMQPPSNFKNISMHIRDYFGIFEKEKFAVEEMFYLFTDTKFEDYLKSCVEIMENQKEEMEI